MADIDYETSNYKEVKDDKDYNTQESQLNLTNNQLIMPVFNSGDTDKNDNSTELMKMGLIDGPGESEVQTLSRLSKKQQAVGSRL